MEGEVSGPELGGAFGCGGLQARELLEDEGQVLRIEVGAEGAGGLGAGDELRVELLGVDPVAPQVLGGLEAAGELDRQRVRVGLDARAA